MKKLMEEGIKKEEDAAEKRTMEALKTQRLDNMQKRMDALCFGDEMTGYAPKIINDKNQQRNTGSVKKDEGMFPDSFNAILPDWVNKAGSAVTHWDGTVDFSLIADDDYVDVISWLVNGGGNGLTERRKYLEELKKKFKYETICSNKR